MKKRWYWSFGVERWPGGFQVGLGFFTLHFFDGGGRYPWVPLWWWNRD